MPRRARRLQDILEACDSIHAFLEDVDEPEFRGDDLLRSAVLLKLLVIGEAASQLGKPFHDEHEHVPWEDIVALRNLLIHQYFRVDWSIVWTTATEEVPRLRDQVANILDEGDGVEE
jgi:uncharacterized protein with HEPN domain